MGHFLNQVAGGVAVTVVAVLVMLLRAPPSVVTDVSGLYAVDMRFISKELRRKPAPALGAAEIQNLFLPLQKDSETQIFIDSRHANARTIQSRISNAILTIGRATIGKLFLNGNSEVIGLLFPGGLFVASEEHFRKLLEPVLKRAYFDQFQLLDIGAGDGSVTAALARACNLDFASVWTVEAAMSKRWRLQRAGFQVLTDLPPFSSVYDVLVILNVLDVAQDGAQLLSDALAMLKPGGFLVLGLVLPYRPKLNFGVNTLAGLSTDLNASNTKRGAVFEKNFVELLHFLSAYPLLLQKWTRVPYLSGGDQRSAVYVYDEALMLLEKT